MLNDNASNYNYYRYKRKFRKDKPTKYEKI